MESKKINKNFAVWINLLFLGSGFIYLRKYWYGFVSFILALIFYEYLGLRESLILLIAIMYLTNSEAKKMIANHERLPKTNILFIIVMIVGVLSVLILISSAIMLWSGNQQLGEINNTDEKLLKTNLKNTNSISRTFDPEIIKSEPYLKEIILEDEDLRTLSASIVKDCPSGNKNCYVNAIYRYVVENYNYYNDPRTHEYIQPVTSTINIGGGDCEDLTILLNSLLENLGIKTYLVLADNHAYSLACGINSEKLRSYIDNSLIDTFSDNILESGEKGMVYENGELFFTIKDDSKRVLKGKSSFYSGGNGSSFDEGDYMNIRYSITSIVPLDLYVVPSSDDFHLIANHRTFTHYPECKDQQFLKISDSCDYLKKRGGIVLVNNNYDDAVVDLEIIRYFNYPLPDSLQSNIITSYTIKEEKCIVLDPTLGKYGYPGYPINVTGDKIAIDPFSKEKINLS